MAWRRFVLIALFLVGVIVLGLGAWVRSLLWVPADVEDVVITCAPDTPTLTSGDSLTILVWNVQYGASRKHRFFYDGGEAVGVPAADVVETLDAIAAVVREHDPDIVLFQEIDRGSRRTGFLDEHSELLARVPYPCHLSTPYHRVGYVPTPSHEHLGKVDMHLSVFSKVRLDRATRTQLALLDEPAWRQAFNLRRALLTVTVPTVGNTPFTLLNTHLSAFSKNDGTLDRQMAQLDAAMRSAGTRWILGGDLNALPPDDDPSRLGAEGLTYYAPKGASPVQRLFDDHHSVVPREAYTADPGRWRTYVPFAAAEPDRTLDYVFAGSDVTVDEVAVLPVLDVSDHLPILLTVTP